MMYVYVSNYQFQTDLCMLTNVFMLYYLVRKHKIKGEWGYLVGGTTSYHSKFNRNQLNLKFLMMWTLQYIIRTCLEHVSAFYQPVSSLNVQKTGFLLINSSDSYLKYLLYEQPLKLCEDGTWVLGAAFTKFHPAHKHLS